MDSHDTPEEARHRREIRSWLEQHLPPGWGQPGFREPGSGGSEGAEERVAFAREWQGKRYEGGWAGLDWPVEFGGRGASILECMIYHEEYHRARAPDLIVLSVGTALVGPTLIHHGSLGDLTKVMSTTGY